MKLIATLLFLTGCSNVLGNEYFVTIDPNFSKEDRESIIASVGEWQDALPDNLTVSSISVGTCAAAMMTDENRDTIPNPGTRREICIHAAQQAWVDSRASNTEGRPVLAITFRHDADDSADIYLPIDKVDIPMTNHQSITHELGHAMGLKHMQAGALMYWNLDDQSQTPTCDDAAQWLSIRHMSVKTRLCPNGGSFILSH